MSEERRERRHRRFILELPLWVSFQEKSRREDETPPESEPGEERTTTIAVSAVSCLFYAAKKPVLGARATMRVEIPLRDTGRCGQVLCKGSVVWVSARRVKGKVGVACTIDSYRFAPPGKT